MRAFAQEQREIDRYNKQIENVLQLSYKEAAARGLFWGFVSIVLIRTIIQLIQNQSINLKIDNRKWTEGPKAFKDPSVLKVVL